jgi:DNA-directed RNA polymerase subunit RPC12/RpoP
MTTDKDPWAFFRILKRATIIGISLFFLIAALFITRAIDRGSVIIKMLVWGWAIFVVVMITLTHEVRCPRCGKRFYAKGGDFSQMTFECLHCGQEKYGDLKTGVLSEKAL